MSLGYIRKIAALLTTGSFCFISVFSQPTQFSLATDVSMLRSFKEGQQYWAIGQTVNFQFHFYPKDAAYAWICYYSDGRIVNNVAATAKSTSTTPQSIPYTNETQLRFKHVSMGWKHYFAGKFDNEKLWNIYGYAGFGLMIGRSINTPSSNIDTTAYFTPVIFGKGNFKRLTIDPGFGVEIAVGGGIFFYLETRALVPISYYPSPYLLVNYKAPLVGSANLGIIILFE